MLRLATAAIALAILGTPVRADDLVIYGAGSLREAIGQIAQEFGQAHGVTVTTQFGHSGRMRERIENGERADLFTSADVGHARKLVDDGRASIMAVFVRNTVCLLAPNKLGASPESALDTLLAPGRRFGMSPPHSDPLGDYTLRLFETAERLRPGSASILQTNAIVLDASKSAEPPKSGDADADAILEGRVDASIVYCSAKDRYARLLPAAAVIQFPANLQVGPEYAMAVLKEARPMTLLLALSILSPDGQRILSQHGFRPVTLPGE